MGRGTGVDLDSEEDVYCRHGEALGASPRGSRDGSFVPHTESMLGDSAQCATQGGLLSFCLSESSLPQ